MTGDQLRQIRLVGGVSQRDVANALHYRQSRLASMEAETFREVPQDTVLRYVAFVLSEAECHWVSVQQYRSLVEPGKKRPR